MQNATKCARVQSSRITAIFQACLAGMILLLGACTEPDTNPVSKGSLNISFSIPNKAALSGAVTALTASRTIRPDFKTEIDSIELSISLNGGSTTLSQTLPSTNSVALFENIEAGSWTMQALAYSNGIQIGAATDTVDISAGSHSITLTFAFDQGSGTSTLNLPVSWPSSSNVDWVSLSVDGGTASALAIDSTSSESTTTAQISIEALSPGAHQLLLSFRRGGSAGTPAGDFVEYANVFAGSTIYGWIGNDGSVYNMWPLAAADFLDSNTSLAGLALSLDGAALDIGFSSAVTDYSARLAEGSTLNLTPTQSVAGQYLSYTWNAGSAVALGSGAQSGPLALANSNTLAIKVTAPDGTSTRTYTVSLQLIANASITFGLAQDYQGLKFSSENTTISTHEDLTIDCSNPVLTQSGSSWHWFADGVELLDSTESALTWSSAMPGEYILSCTVLYNDVEYSGSLKVTVTQ